MCFFCRRWCLVATSLLMDSSVCTTCVLTHSSSASVSRCLQFTEYLLYFNVLYRHRNTWRTFNWIILQYTQKLSSLYSVCLSPSQWRTWNEMMDLYRSLTSCPKTSWRSSTNPTKHQKEVKGRTEDHFTFWVHDATQTESQNVRLSFFNTVFSKNKFTKTNLLILHLLLILYFI